MEYIGSHESNGLKMDAWRNELGQVEIVFGTIDRGYRAGILHVSHEISLACNATTGSWSGDELGVEWFEYDEETAREKAEELGLPDAVRECIEALGIEL